MQKYKICANSFRKWTYQLSGFIHTLDPSSQQPTKFMLGLLNMKSPIENRKHC